MPRCELKHWPFGAGGGGNPHLRPETQLPPSPSPCLPSSQNKRGNKREKRRLEVDHRREGSGTSSPGFPEALAYSLALPWEVQPQPGAWRAVFLPLFPSEAPAHQPGPRGGSARCGRPASWPRGRLCTVDGQVHMHPRPRAGHTRAGASLTHLRDLRTLQALTTALYLPGTLSLHPQAGMLSSGGPPPCVFLKVPCS